VLVLWHPSKHAATIGPLPSRALAPSISSHHGCTVCIVRYALGSRGVGEGLVPCKALEWPLFFATATYSMEGVANLLPVENALEDKSQIFTLIGEAHGQHKGEKAYPFF